MNEKKFVKQKPNTNFTMQKIYRGNCLIELKVKSWDYECKFEGQR